MPKPLKPARLGEAAYAYVEGRLRNGKTLSRLFLTHHDLVGGDVTADLPAEFVVTSLTDFGDGGIFHGENPQAELVSRIVSFLATSEGAVVICEEQLAKPSDPVVKKFSSKTLRTGDELYHVLEHSDANAETVQTTLSWQANAWQELIFFSQLALPLRRPRAATLSAHDVDLIAQGAVAVCVSAFDGEGYVMWNARAGRVAA